MVIPFRALASALFERARLARLAGLTFGGKRDLYEALGYQRLLTAEDYRARYRRNGIAARVVEAFPQATWRDGIEIIEEEDPEVITPFEEAWNELAERLTIWPTLARADVLAGIGRFAVILIGAPGDPATPLPARLKPEQIAYLAPYAEDDVDIERYDVKLDSPRFGLPEMYKITRRNTEAVEGFRTLRVHWSRAIHIADGILDDRVFGQPRMERIWNLLDDLEKVTGSGAEAFWLRAHQGFHYNLEKDLVMDPDEVTKVKEAADELAHGLRRTIATRGMDLQVLGSDVANFNQPVDAIITLIAGATEIPKRILVGSERGELSSSQDKTNWDERVTDRRTQFAEPLVIRPLVDLLIARGALPEAEYRVSWPESEELDEVQKADVATKWAGLNKASGGNVVLDSEIRDKVLGLEPLTDQQLEEIEAKKQEALQAQQEAMGGAPPGRPGAEGAEGEGGPQARAAARGKALPRSGQLHTEEFDVSRMLEEAEWL